MLCVLKKIRLNEWLWLYIPGNTHHQKHHLQNQSPVDHPSVKITSLRKKGSQRKIELKFKEKNESYEIYRIIEIVMKIIEAVMKFKELDIELGTIILNF